MSLVDRYFEAFQNRNLEALSECYADDVVLNEWNQNVFVGKEAVLEANKQLFDQFINIKINRLKSAAHVELPLKYVHFEQIEVILTSANGTETTVNVIDVITTRQGLNHSITDITAYKGFA